MERKVKGKLIYLPFLIAAILFIVPFFWFWGGLVDWGGDSTRIYYLNPRLYILHHALFGVSPSDTGGQIVAYYSLPYLFILAFLRSFLDASLVVALTHGLKLSLSFLFVYLSIRELLSSIKNLKHYTALLASILSGFLYILSPVSTIGWDKVILTHDQFFLNPLMFYLLLKFFDSGRILFLLLAAFITFFFSHNFSFGAAPPVAAFYPLALVFLLSYQHLRKKPIYFKKLIFVFFIFLLLQAFHLLPLVLQVFQPGSDSYANIFSPEGKYDRGLSYFTAIAKVVRVSKGLLLQPQLSEIKLFNVFTIIVPITIVLSFCLRKSKLLVLAGLTFLVATYFSTANITFTGVEIYKQLFSVPGFSMFRNFFGQWNYSFLFFYCLLFGLSFYYLILGLGKKSLAFVFIIISSFLVFSSIGFLKGESVDKPIWQSNKVRLLSKPDKNMLDALEYLRNISDDAKVLTLPITDPGYQILIGSNGGAYQGPSLVAYLSGKKDFPGLNSFGLYSTVLQNAAKNNDFRTLKQIFAIFNIKYIFYNSDVRAYDKNFPKFPYDTARQSFPDTQNEYKKFIKNLGTVPLKSFGTYHILEIENPGFTPHIYAANNVVSTNNPLSAFAAVDQKASGVAFAVGVKTRDSNISEFFEARSKSPYKELFYNSHLHIHNPFVSRSPFSVIYPLVLYKEELDIKSRINSITDYTDYNLYILTKRVLELVMFGDRMSLSKGNDLYGGAYTTWISNTHRLYDHYRKIIDYIHNSKSTESEKLAELIKVQEQVLRSQSQLVTFLVSSNKPEKEKKEIIIQVNKVFGKVKNLIKSPMLSADKSDYSITLPKENLAEYSIYIENIEQQDSTYSPSELLVEGNNIDLGQGQESGRYIKFSNVSIKEGGSLYITYNGKRRNLYTGEQSITLSSATLQKKVYTIKLRKMMPEKQYLISFEYKVSPFSNFKYSFLDTKKESPERNQYFEKDISSSTWEKAQTIITTDPQFVEGYIDIKNNNFGNQKIEIRDIEVKEILDPVIIIAKDATESLKPPKVSFTKINSTKYEVNIREVKGPYFLVLSDQFGSEWKLFNKGKMVSASSHYIANGYANGWWITPNDINGVSYSLVLENTSQRRFYWGATLSLIAFIGLIVMIVNRILKWEKK